RDLELAHLLVVDASADDVGGHQVGRELHALELAAGGARQRLHGERLGQAGHAFDEDVAPREQGDQHALEQRVLADDHALDLVEDLLERRLGRPGGTGPTGGHWAGAPAARPAAPMGTAKPMPTLSSLPDGLARPVTMPITWPFVLSSGPPELPGLTGA